MKITIKANSKTKRFDELKLGQTFLSPEGMFLIKVDPFLLDNSKNNWVIDDGTKCNAIQLNSPDGPTDNLFWILNDDEECIPLNCELVVR